MKGVKTWFIGRRTSQSRIVFPFVQPDDMIRKGGRGDTRENNDTCTVELERKEFSSKNLDWKHSAK